MERRALAEVRLDDCTGNSAREFSLGVLSLFVMLLLEGVVCGTCSKGWMGGLRNCSSPPLLLEGGSVCWTEPLLGGRESESSCVGEEGEAFLWEDSRGSLEKQIGFCWEERGGCLWDALRGMKGTPSLGETAYLLACGLLFGFEARDKVYGMGGKEREEVGWWVEDAVGWKVEEDGESRNFDREGSF